MNHQTRNPPVPGEVVRYVLNGLLATAVHYGVLSCNLKLLSMPSAGLANLIAALVGISVSFLGNRYFVFRKSAEKILPQAVKFWTLYVGIALLHGAVLFVWSDVHRLDYRTGFLIATFMQFVLSYAGNKILVFRA